MSEFKEQIKLSPSSLNLFQECPRCFWLEKKKGIKRPPPFPYTLNSAVDFLLKAEFDKYRQTKEIYPLLTKNKIKARFFDNQELLKKWRNNLQGLRYFDEELQALLFGAVDDILVDEKGLFSPLDVKATGGANFGINERFILQLSIYSYLLEKNGLPVSGKGYLVYFVVNKTENGFQGKLPFEEKLFEIDTNHQLVVDIFKKATNLLKQKEPPLASPDCLFCQYVNRAKIL